MEFEPQNDLERSLMRAIIDPAHRPQFDQDFLDSDVYFLQAGPLPEAPGELPEGFALQIEAIEFEGQSYLPIYSSLFRLQETLATRELGNHIALNARRLLTITRGANFMLNPASTGRMFAAAYVAALLDGSPVGEQEPYVVPAEAEVQLRYPDPYPTELEEALKRFFKTTKAVKRAWLANILVPGRDTVPHTALAVQASGDFGELVNQIVTVISHDVPIPQPPVDILPVTEGGEGLEVYFWASVPFYQKRFLGIF